MGDLFYGYSLSLGSLYQGGRWDQDNSSETPYVPAVFKSTDDGKTWQRTALSTSEGTIKSLTVHPIDKKIVYAGGKIGADFDWMDGTFAFYKSTDGGTSWNAMGFSSAGQIYSMLIDPLNANRMYLGTSKGVYISTDGGTNWKSPSKTLSVFCLLLDAKTPNKAYAGTNQGVFVTTNSGTDWAEMNTGLTSMKINCMDMDPVNNVLYAGTTGSGVFRISVTTGVENQGEKKPEQFVLHQNYPNPFNASTVIRYDLNKKENVRLSIIDVHGRLVRILSDGMQSSGLNQVVWDGRDESGKDLPSGMYFCRLETEAGWAVRKLVIQR